MYIAFEGMTFEGIFKHHNAMREAWKRSVLEHSYMYIYSVCKCMYDEIYIQCHAYVYRSNTAILTFKSLTLSC